MLSSKRSKIANEKEPVKYVKFRYIDKETKFTAKLF